MDVIAASPTGAAMAARNASRTIPIVGMSLTEPVELGLVASLARPGGNVTGVTYGVDADIFGKQLGLLREAVPKVRRVAVLSKPSPAQPLIIRKVRAAARSLGLQLQLLEAREPGEFDGAFAAMAKETRGRAACRGGLDVLHPPGAARRTLGKAQAAGDSYADAMGGGRRPHVLRAELA